MARWKFQHRSCVSAESNRSATTMHRKLTRHGLIYIVSVPKKTVSFPMNINLNCHRNGNIPWLPRMVFAQRTEMLFKYKSSQQVHSEVSWLFHWKVEQLLKKVSAHQWKNFFQIHSMASSVTLLTKVLFFLPTVAMN